MKKGKHFGRFIPKQSIQRPVFVRRRIAPSDLATWIFFAIFILYFVGHIIVAVINGRLP